MAITQFPNKRYVRVFANNETVRMGSFTLAKNGELAHMKILMFIRSALAGTEKVRLKIYSSAEHTANSLVATSDWTELSVIEEKRQMTSTVGWYGWILLDFDRQYLSINTTYYVAGEISLYTRNADTFYIGLVHDHLSPIYGTAQTRFYNNPMGFIIYNYEERS